MMERSPELASSRDPSPENKEISQPFQQIPMTYQRSGSVFSRIPSVLHISRPMPPLTLAFGGGILLGHYTPSILPNGTLILLSSLLMGCLLAINFRGPAPLRSLIPPLAFFLILGLWAARLSSPIMPHPPELEPFFERPQTLFLAEVLSSPEFHPEKTRLPVKLLRAYIEGKSLAVKGGILVTIDGNPEMSPKWLPGDRLLLRLTLKRFHDFQNPGGYSYTKRQAEKGYFGRARLSDARWIIKLAPPSEPLPQSALRYLGNRLEKFRQETLFWLLDNLEAETGNFYAALLLGYRNRISNAWNERLNRAGVTHLLAISGLHLGLVGMSVFWLIRRMVRILCPSILMWTSDQKLAIWGALPAAILYALISGLALPTWRAAIMLFLLMGGLFCYRFSDSTTALASAALLILLIAPSSLREASFQLSFAAIIGLFALYPIFQKTLYDIGPLKSLSGSRWGKIPRIFLDAFGVSLAANIMVLPILVHHFHGVSLAGFIANTVLVPLIGFLVLPFGLTGLALSALSKGIALPFLVVGGFFLQCAQKIILWFSDLSWAYFWVGNIPIPWIIAFYGTLAMLLSPWRRQRKALGLTALLLFCTTLELSQNILSGSAVSKEGKILKVTVIDVGQGSSTFLRFPNGENMLIDGGGFFDNSFDVGKSVVAPYLWYEGIRRLDHVVLSHDHPDHKNGLRFILSGFEIGDFWESGIIENPAGFNELSTIAHRRQIPVKRLPQMMKDQTFGPCNLRILHPTPSYIQKEWDGTDLNNVSLVLQIDYGNTRLILPGDIDRSVESHLFGSMAPDGKRVLLVSPHHGSGRSNSAVLLDHLQPQAIIFSCGYENWFGFPSPEAIQRCAERHISIYRTDLQGAIHAVSDGRQWTITAQQDLESHAKLFFGRGLR
ncbi:DNA internalization-related competence protein ComEC/Rec2 [Desulforhabdus amnigena]|nr:DNA internalization-related competence protein ComEC/Rec2 [Desulforhabdus amnigena]NLJ28795.1 DNA internalization-related competence protein ComEC/Rec2 [Deltaproteobacteria bacterium]